MKIQVEQVWQDILVKFGFFLGMTAALGVGMPTPVPSACNSTCSVKHHSSEQKSSANCSSRGQDRAPEVCSFVEELIMDYNQIHHIDNEMFETFHQLAYLRMRNNGMYKIDAGSFRNTTLRDIDLSENRLETLDVDVFMNLSRLTQLNLKNNELEEIGSYHLTSLTSLIISHNFITELDDRMFRHMPNLKNLDLSHNQIMELVNNFLGNLRNLTTLRLSNNAISSIDVNAFVNLNKLKELHLDNNQISSSELRDSLSNTQNNLTVLNVSNNYLTTLPPTMLFQLKGSLEQFSASNNNIASIGGHTFIGFTKLQTIDLTYNMLTADAKGAFQTLVGKSGTQKVKILLEGNPICEKYLDEFKDYYNVTVFCSRNQTEAYAAKEELNTGAPVVDIPPTDEQNQQEILTTVCYAVAAVLAVLVILLPIIIWKRYRWRGSASNLRQIFSNSGYNLPRRLHILHQVPQYDPPPPPVPVRGPGTFPPEDLEGPYINGRVNSSRSLTSYIQPVSTCSSRGRGLCPCHHKHSRLTHSSRPPGPPTLANSSPDLHRIGKNSPEMDKSITIVGTNFGGSCRQMHVTGLPKIQRQWRESMSRRLPEWYAQRFETRDGRPLQKGAEKGESTYMLRQEGEDGRPIIPTLIEPKNSATAEKT